MEPVRRLTVQAGLVAFAAGAVCTPHLLGQSPAGGATVSQAPTFEVASVKPNNSGDGRVAIIGQPGGRITMTNVPLRLMIRNAYRVQDSQIVGGPDWLNTARFDVAAKADGNAPADDMQSMMRALLAERFKLVTHNESRELPVYALVPARTDARPGPQLKKSNADCGAGRGSAPPAPCLHQARCRRAAWWLDSEASEPAALPSLRCRPRLPAPPDASSSIERASPTGSTSSSPGRPINFPSGSRAPAISRWSSTARRSIPTVRRSSRRCRNSSGSSWNRRRAPVDVLVIDRAEKPTED